MDTLILKILLQIMKINNFRDDLKDVSAKNTPLTPMRPKQILFVVGNKLTDGQDTTQTMGGSFDQTLSVSVILVSKLSFTFLWIL